MVTSTALPVSPPQDRRGSCALWPGGEWIHCSDRVAGTSYNEGAILSENPAEVPVSDADLCAVLAQEMASYSALRSALPPHYPAGIATWGLMQEFDRARKKPGGHWHLTNLPYTLYLANQKKWPKANQLAGSVLATLDRFCSEFSAVPRFQDVLRPLAKGIWKQDDPEFWSVFAHASVTLLLHDKGFEIREFSAPMPGGHKDADILVRSPLALKTSVGLDMFLDIVMKHRPTFRTVEEAREELHRHAESKASSKFSDAMKHGIQAIVIVVCVVSGKQMEVLLQDPNLLSAIDGPTLERPENLHVAYFAMSGARQDGRSSWRLFSRAELAVATPAPLEPPRS